MRWLRCELRELLFSVSQHYRRWILIFFSSKHTKVQRKIRKRRVGIKRLIATRGVEWLKHLRPRREPLDVYPAALFFLFFLDGSFLKRLRLTQSAEMLPGFSLMRWFVFPFFWLVVNFLARSCNCKNNNIASLRHIQTNKTMTQRKFPPRLHLCRNVSPGVLFFLEG